MATLALFASAWALTLAGEAGRSQAAHGPLPCERAFATTAAAAAAAATSSPRFLASAGGLVVLGALGALTHDSNVSPMIGPYRECSAAAPSGLAPAPLPMADAGIRGLGQQQQQAAAAAH